MIEDTRLFKKVFGCYALGAIGDTLGRPAEGMNYPDIDAKLGRLENPFALMTGEESFEIGTDDTALGQILSHCYLDHGRQPTVEEYGEYWLKEMDPLKFFFCLRNTYELLKMGYSARMTGILNIVTGSGLMAVHPVGVFNAGDPERAYVDGTNMAAIVQRDLDMFIPGVIAAAVAEAFRAGATWETVIEAAIRVAPSKPFVTFDERDPNNLKDTLIQAVEIGRKAPDVFAARGPLYENCLQYHMIDPQEVFALTFGIFAAAKGDTRAGIVGGANIGRDADTIPSRNGQILGALNGIDSAPKEWVEGLERTRSHEPLYRTAVDMTELLVRRSREARTLAAEVDAML